jgi:putative ABC transport system permease protein
MLFRKMLRDMGRRKTQFISIFLMAFLAVFIYCGIGGEWRGILKSSNDFYKKTNLADIFIYGNSFSAEQADAVYEVENVVNVERRLEIDAVLNIENFPALKLYFVEKGEISMPYTVDGDDFDIRTSGIWLDCRFAKANGVEIGDEISVTFNSAVISKTVRAFIYSPEHVFEAAGDTLTPDFAKSGYAYLAAGEFPFPEVFAYSTMLVDTDGGQNLEDKIGAVLGNGLSVYLEQKNHQSVNMFTSEIAQHKMMGDIFPVVFVLIALLTMLTTMTRLVNNQRVQIGTLKALGFKKSAILWHYISYGLFLSLSGAVLGLVLGPVTLPYLFFPSMSGFYTLPVWAPAVAPDFFLVVFVFAAFGAFVSYLSCGNLLSESPADTLKPKILKISTHGLLEKTKLWDKLGFGSQWNIRDARRNPMRSAMAIIGVFGCTAILVCAFGMNNSMNDLKAWRFEKNIHYESKIVLSGDASAAQVEDIANAVNGQFIMEQNIEIKANGKKISCGVTVIDDNSTMVTFTDSNFKRINLPENGVSLTLKSAEILGTGKGDVLEWHIYGTSEWKTVIIAQIIREPVNQGLAMSKSTLESLGIGFTPTAVLSAQKITDTFDAVSQVILTQDSISGWDELTQSMSTLTFLMIAAAAVLSVVVLYNLGLLFFIETERSFAILKVVGLSTRKLRNLLLAQNIFFSVIGFAFGVPMGLWLIEIICAFSGESFDFPISLHFSNFSLSFLLTFGFSVLVNFAFSGKIKRLNMVETLKSAE